MNRRLQLIGVLAISFLGLGAWQAAVKAYATWGVKWGGSNVPYYVNPDNLYVPQADAIAAVQTAASAWSTQSNANIQLNYAGTTNGSSAALNYKNEVFFRNDAPGPIAQTYWWADGSGRLLDADIVFYESFVFYTGNVGCTSGHYIENAATHEFGHALGVAHSAVDTATMWPYASSCETVRETLDPDDVAAIESLYPPTSVAPLPPPPPPPPPDPVVVSAPAIPDGASPADGATGVNTSVTLSWNCTGADHYDVYISGALYVSNLTNPSVAVSSLANGSAYSWTVVASNSVGSTTGPTWWFTTKTATTTGKPGRGQGRKK